MAMARLCASTRSPNVKLLTLVSSDPQPLGAELSRARTTMSRSHEAEMSLSPRQAPYSSGAATTVEVARGQTHGVAVSEAGLRQ